MLILQISSIYTKVCNRVTIREVFEFLTEKISIEYGEPHPDYIPWDSEEKCFLDEGDSLTTVIEEEGAGCRHGQILELLNRMSISPYVRFNSYVPTAGEYNIELWAEFSAKIKSGNIDIEVFRTLASVTDFARSLLPIKKLAPSQVIYRARHGHTYEPNACELGTFPAKPWIFSRFVSFGQEAFYGVLDKTTAQREIDAAMATPHYLGAWKPNKTIHVIDLATPLQLPSIFSDSQNASRRDAIVFLNNFSDEISRPTGQGVAEQEYLPTQFLFKELVFQYRHQYPIDGMVYRSSKQTSGLCVILVVQNSHCIETVINSRRIFLRLIDVEKHP